MPKSPKTFDNKINELKEAIDDKLFLSDLKEVAEVFRHIDLEEWEE